MKPMVIVTVLALACAACGKSKEEQQAEAIQKSAEQLQKSAEGVAKGLGDLAAGISSAAGGEGNVKPVDPVSFRDLIALLPAAPSGWEREKPTGERMTAPVNFAEASVRLTKGDTTVTAKITDSALNQVLVAPFAMFLAGNYEHETDHGYEKAIKVGDAPAFEKWDSEAKSGNLTVIVGKRFIVEIDGSSIDDPKVLHDVLDKIDLKKLEAMH
ncbi:MAG: hypothetical protein Q7J25_13710 [Vicinamibacterales bacterium]|nr:hypothetical protein [Vicinamibacterales bacterium]